MHMLNTGMYIKTRKHFSIIRCILCPKDYYILPILALSSTAGHIINTSLLDAVRGVRVAFWPHGQTGSPGLNV